MTPKEKANHLIKKFSDINYFSNEDILSDAKDTAKDCIQEILIDELGIIPSKLMYDYWEEVIKEIDMITELPC